MTLGQLIGKVVHSFKTTNDHEEAATISVTFDFSTCTDTDIRNWLVSNRAIIMQRPLRTLTLAELKAMNGTTVDASQCGKKVKSKHEQVLAGIAALRAAGMNSEADEILAKYNEKLEAEKTE
jgi:hypothetical protein